MKKIIYIALLIIGANGLHGQIYWNELKDADTLGYVLVSKIDGTFDTVHVSDFYPHFKVQSTVPLNGNKAGDYLFNTLTGDISVWDGDSTFAGTWRTIWDASAVAAAGSQTLTIDSTGRTFTIGISDGNEVKFEDTKLTEEEVEDFAFNSIGTDGGLEYIDGDNRIILNPDNISIPESFPEGDEVIATWDVSSGRLEKIWIEDFIDYINTNLTEEEVEDFALNNITANSPLEYNDASNRLDFNIDKITVPESFPEGDEIIPTWDVSSAQHEKITVANLKIFIDTKLTEEEVEDFALNNITANSPLEYNDASNRLDFNIDKITVPESFPEGDEIIPTWDVSSAQHEKITVANLKTYIDTKLTEEEVEDFALNNLELNSPLFYDDPQNKLKFLPDNISVIESFPEGDEIIPTWDVSEARHEKITVADLKIFIDTKLTEEEVEDFAFNNHGTNDGLEYLDASNKLSFRPDNISIAEGIPEGDEVFGVYDPSEARLEKITWSTLAAINTDDQTLSIVSAALGTISIESGNTIDITSLVQLNEADGSTTNELQSWAIVDTDAGTISLTSNSNLDLTELVFDQVKAFFTGNTETGITVTPQDADNTVDFVVTGGTDDQNLSFGTKTTINIPLDIESGIGVTFREGSNITLDRTASNIMTINATDYYISDAFMSGDNLLFDMPAPLSNFSVDLSQFYDNTDDQQQLVNFSTYYRLGNESQSGTGISFIPGSGISITGTTGSSGSITISATGGADGNGLWDSGNTLTSMASGMSPLVNDYLMFKNAANTTAILYIDDATNDFVSIRTISPSTIDGTTVALNVNGGVNVSGEVAISVTSNTATRIMGMDNFNVVSELDVGDGLEIVSGALSVDNEVNGVARYYGSLNTVTSTPTNITVGGSTDDGVLNAHTTSEYLEYLGGSVFPNSKISWSGGFRIEKSVGTAVGTVSIILKQNTTTVETWTITIENDGRTFVYVPFTALENIDSTTDKFEFHGSASMSSGSIDQIYYEALARYEPYD